tara:strand:- start:83 stop:718 length:636 start_codon:yes stop_codon:yes gene_type:complete
MKKKIAVITLLVIAVLAIGAAMIGPIMSNVEIPDYKILEKTENIEIRRYPPLIIAEVRTMGSRKDSIGDGFRILADFIFGNNKGENKISMTTPVMQQKGTKIEMTAPVQQENTGKEWLVSFIMPSKFSMNTLPKPTNDKIKIVQMPSKNYAAIVFSGRGTKDNLTANTLELKEYLSRSNYSIRGNPKYAFYNPPWTLPFMRRNEVQFELIE